MNAPHLVGLISAYGSACFAQGVALGDADISVTAAEAAKAASDELIAFIAGWTS